MTLYSGNYWFPNTPKQNVISVVNIGRAVICLIRDDELKNIVWYIAATYLLRNVLCNVLHSVLHNVLLNVLHNVLRSVSKPPEFTAVI